MVCKKIIYGKLKLELITSGICANILHKIKLKVAIIIVVDGQTWNSLSLIGLYYFLHEFNGPVVLMWCSFFAYYFAIKRRSRTLAHENIKNNNNLTWWVCIRMTLMKYHGNVISRIVSFGSSFNKNICYIIKVTAFHKCKNVLFALKKYLNF